MFVEVGLERGSLILHDGKKYVVQKLQGALCICVRYDDDAICLGDYVFRVGSECDACFPGPIVELPDYVK